MGIAQTYVQKVAKEGWTPVMECGNFKASLMKAPRLQDDGNVHALPQGSQIPVFPITALPACPGEWVRKEGVYVCPVDIQWGIWLDWTMNDVINTAVVPSIKGINPITGLEVEGPGLHAYRNKCPRHGIEFGPNLICEECGFRWPPQNYVTHESTLWLDGFRQPDGSVRQFFFTDEDARDIASLVIGKENTVPAFGFVFYRPKELRKQQEVFRSILVTDSAKPKKYYSGKNKYNMMSHPIGIPHQTWTNSTDMDDSDSYVLNLNAESGALNAESSVLYCNGDDGLDGLDIGCAAETFDDAFEIAEPSETKSRSVSVGAGAKIRQELARDELGIDGWQEEPAGIIRLYFVFEKQFRDIVQAGGIKGIQTNDSGFLKNLPVG